MTATGRAPLPAIGLGTMHLAGQVCRDIVEAALSEGYRHLDTARRYGNEVEVGAGLARSAVRREEVVLTTKLGPAELAPDDVHAATRDSLARLGTDHVDLLLIHWPNPDVPLEATLGALVELRELGLARAIGVANFPPRLLAEARALTDDLVTDQVEYHPYLAQGALLDELHAAGMVLTAYCPLARGAVLDDPVLSAIAADHGITPAQAALRWLVQQPGVVAIPGTSSPARVRENLAVADGPVLAGDEMAAIHALARGHRVVNPPHAPVWDDDPSAAASRSER